MRSLFGLQLAAFFFCGLFGFSPADAQVSGLVRDANTLQPLEGAIVTLQGTSTRDTTDAAGMFSLPGVSGTDLVIVAAQKAYFNGPLLVTTPMSGVTLDLQPVPQTDDPNYIWKDDTFCALCHSVQESQFSGTPMQATGSNLWVYDLYDGTGTVGGNGGFVYVNDSAHAVTFPEGECASCHQPQKWIGDPFSALQDINNPTPDSMAGVSCEVCHKVADVDETNLNATGFIPGAVTVTRPIEAGANTQQVMYGALGDADYIIPDFMNPSYQPGIRTTTCAVCHQYNSDPDQDLDFDEPSSQPGQSTYTEWLNSSYGDPQSANFQDCVDCHMPAASNDGCIVLPVAREAGQIRSHEMLGTTPAFLENAVTLSLSAQEVGNELQVDVDIANDQTGHHVPTGVSIRNMVLVVEAVRVADGVPLVSTGSQVVDDLGGLGNPAQGYYGGQPGKLFARALEDAGGNAPVLFTEAAGVRFDTRIPALATDSTSYTFQTPILGGDVEVRARLIYRRAYRSLVDAKSWTVDGMGNALADVQAPHYGHLMEESVQVVPTSALDNDDCVAATVIAAGTTAFDTTGATTDGPDEPADCDFFSYTHIDNDRWWRYTATCTGDLEVSLCGSGYDTKLAVYDGVACPPTGGPIVCNDDTCSLQSEVTLTVTQGNEYLIRIGGYQGATGSGTIEITCTGPSCDPVTSTTCVSSGADVTLGWSNQDTYSGLNIYRSDVGLLATVGGGTQGYVDAMVPNGTYTYTIEAECGGVPTAGTDCVVTHTPPVGPQFVRTDCNVDGGSNLADVVSLLGYLFPQPPPPPILDCEDACDCNDDGQLSIADAVCILESQFGVPAVVPDAPFPACGSDPTADALDCDAFSACP